MFKIIYPSADATLYESLPTYNTGLDEILTLRDSESTTDLNHYPSRILLQFTENLNIYF